MDTNSEEWRHLCEARAVLRLPLLKRKAFLLKVEDKRGIEERKRIQNTMRTLWVEQQVKLLIEMDSQGARQDRLARIEQSAGYVMRRDVEAALEKLS